MSENITNNPSVPSQIVSEVKFPRFINNLGIIPTSYKDSMDYYENLAWLCKYLEETVIPTVNQNGNAVQELQGLYIQLQEYVVHYFDNLNVQTEINNKLDKMAQDGTLANIVGQYVQPLIDAQNSRINQLENTINSNNTATNSQLATMNNVISSIVSGSPAGVYASAQALATADPDHTKIYLVTADNYWYYYNTTSSQWTAGGTYQSSQFTENNIDVTDLYFGETGNQLFDYTKTDARGYYKVDGSFQSNANMTGMYIDLRKLNASQITTNIETYSAFLDLSKNVITAYVPLSSGTYNIPSGASYFYVAKDTPNAYRVMVNTGSTGLSYQSYERKLNVTIPSYNDTMIELDKGFSNSVITPDALTFVHNGNNLINMNTKLRENDVYYSYSAGARVESNNYNTLILPINPSSNYVASNMQGHITEWTIDDIFITGHLASNTSTPVIFTTNENTKYLKISYVKTQVTDSVIPMLNTGTSALTFEPFTISVDGLTSGGSHFRPYQSGFITFNVSVNQIIPEVTTTENTVDDSQTFENVDCMLKLPLNYTASGKPTKLLMICHGAGRPVVGADTCWINTDSYVNMINNFVSNGYTVFDCNGASNSHYDFWGSPVGMSAYRKAYEYVTQNYNVETNLNIYGFSMGGLTALNLAFQDFPNIKAIALGSPVINLEEAWNNNIASLYSTTTTTYSDDLVAGYNPNLNIKTFNNSYFVFKKLPPIKIWYGGNETYDVRPYVDKTLGQRLVNAIKNSGGVAQYREFAGCGHEICYGSNSNAYTEFAMWLNRF